MYCYAHKTATLTPIQHTVNYANSDFDCAHLVCCSSATISLENENENFSPPKLVKYMIVSSTF